MLLVYTLGVKPIIMAINRMDSTKPIYSAMCFHKITREVRAYIKKTGYNLPAVAFMFISGWRSPAPIRPGSRAGREKTDQCSGMKLEDNPKAMKSGIVPIVLGKAMFMKMFSVYPPLSYFAV
ncbi:hypothetical protein CB1_002029001 [Camelus ferus]|nr:hypothetical protein CB1_002029001 [Camelus ferus]